MYWSPSASSGRAFLVCWDWVIFGGMKAHLLVAIFCISNISYGQENNELVPYIKGDLYGYANSKGEIIVEPTYSYARPFKKGFGLVNLDETQLEPYRKYGLINQKGEVILEPTARRISEFDTNGLAKVQGENEMYGVINQKGDWIVPVKHPYITIKFGFIKLQKSTGEVSLLDLKGHTIIGFNTFGSIEVSEHQSIDRTLVVVIKESKRGLIQIQDDTYKVLINPQYEELTVFNNQHFSVKQNGKYGLINRKNEVIIPLAYDWLEMQLGFIVAHKTIKYEPKIKTIEPVLNSAENYFLRVQKEYDDTNKVVYYLMTKEYQNLFKQYGQDINQETNTRTKSKLFDTYAQEIIPEQFGHIMVLGNNLISSRSKKGINLYDYKGSVLSPNIFYDVHSLEEGLRVVMARTDTNSESTYETNEFKCGYIDTMGKMVFPLMYDEAFSFNKNLAPVKQQGKWALMNKKGKYLTKFKYDHLQYAGDNRYAFRQDTLWGFLNLNGQEVIPATYPEMKTVYYKKNRFTKYSIFNFKNGFATIFGYEPENGRISRTLIDTNGVQLFPLKYDDIEPREGDLFKVTQWIKELDRERVGLIDKTGNELIPIYQREINWLPIEKVYQVISEDYEYFYYDRFSHKVESPYKKIERIGLTHYRQLPNGFFAANTKYYTIYFTPAGIPLYQE